MVAEKSGCHIKVLIVCQAGSGIGLGHLSRSLVIAKAFRARFKADVRLLIQSDSLERDDLKAYPHQFLPPNDELAEQIVKQDPVDLVLLDLQPERVPRELGNAISVMRKVGAKVVAIDGLLECRPELDLIFIPSFHFEPPANLEKGAPIVFGWDCFLIDPQLSPLRWRHGRRVLALSGGSDATQLGETWPAILNETLPAATQLHWVTGPFAKRPIWPAAPRIRMVEHIAPTGLGLIMQESQYAVTVFGVSFFELLYLGVPTVVFSPYGSKDSKAISAIETLGVALVATSEREATKRLTKLMANDELALQLSQRSQAQIYLSGVRRLCSEITALMVH